MYNHYKTSLVHFFRVVFDVFVFDVDSRAAFSFPSFAKYANAPSTVTSTTPANGEISSARSAAITTVGIITTASVVATRTVAVVGPVGRVGRVASIVPSRRATRATPPRGARGARGATARRGVVVRAIAARIVVVVVVVVVVVSRARSRRRDAGLRDHTDQNPARRG